MSNDSMDSKILAANQNIKERDFWLNNLAGEIEKISFPFSFKKTGEINYEIKKIENKIPSSIALKIINMSNESDQRLLVILLSSLLILIEKYTGNTDIILGLPINNQDFEGNFINTIITIR